MRIAVLGISGMAGHVVGRYLLDRGHDVHGFARNPLGRLQVPATSLDLSTLEGISKILSLKGFDAVVNCIGILPRVASENPALAVLINSYLPNALVQSFRDTSTRVVHLSTDCVFSGREGGYREDAFRDGDSVYDRTKASGEFDSQKDLVLRQSIVGPELRSSGVGLLHWFLSQSGTVGGYSNAIWNGVTTLELARGIEQALTENLSGLYHLVAPKPLSKLELLELFEESFARDVTIASSALPQRVDKSLVNTRTDFSFAPAPLETQLGQLREWMNARESLYPHYQLKPMTSTRRSVGEL